MIQTEVGIYNRCKIEQFNDPTTRQDSLNQEMNPVLAALEKKLGRIIRACVTLAKARCNLIPFFSF